MSALAFLLNAGVSDQAADIDRLARVAAGIIGTGRSEMRCDLR